MRYVWPDELQVASGGLARIDEAFMRPFGHEALSQVLDTDAAVATDIQVSNVKQLAWWGQVQAGSATKVRMQVWLDNDRQVQVTPAITSNEGGAICSIFAAQATKGVESVGIFAAQPIMLIAEFKEWLAVEEKIREENDDENLHDLVSNI